LPITCSHYPQFLFDLISRWFFGVSSFLSLSNLAVTTFCGILSLFLLSILPRYLNMRNLTISSIMSSVSNAGITYCKVWIFLLNKTIS
jgi:hypothetical protein